MPLYRNWQSITSLGAIDHHLMMAFAFLDLSTPFGEDVARRFPEYFSAENSEHNGAIPLSVIREAANKAGEEEHDGGDDYADRPTCVSTLETFDIPVFSYSLSARAVDDWGDPLLPIGLRSVQQQGDVVVCEGRKLMCIEYNQDTGTVAFVPAERVDATR